MSHDSLSDVSTSDHHVKYTDAEVEAIITAELVDGQSIDNAIDSLISTHASDNDAHHTLDLATSAPDVTATAAEVNTVADGSTAKNAHTHDDRYYTESETDTEIDTDIATHAADDDAHHAVVENHSDLGDTTLTGAYLEDLLMFGSGNATWYPCTLGGDNTDSTQKTVNQWGGKTYNQGSVDMLPSFQLPLPTTKGALKLYCTGWLVKLRDADGGDYVTRVRILGHTLTAETTIKDDTSNATAQQDHDDTFAAEDLSSYDVIGVQVDCVTTTRADLQIAGVFLQVYYAT